MSKVFIAALCLFLSVSCSKNKSTIDNVPAAVRAVIDENKDCICDPVVDEYKYGSAIVYHFYSLGPACNTVSTFRDANGVVMSKGFEPLYIEMLDNTVFLRNIWKCSQK